MWAAMRCSVAPGARVGSSGSGRSVVMVAANRSSGIRALPTVTGILWLISAMSTGVCGSASAT